MRESKSAANKLSFWAILVIAANTMNGPGLTTLPSIASSAGQVLFCAFVGVAACATSFVVRRLCGVMWKTRKSQVHIHGPKLDESDIVALSDRFFDKKRAASMAMVCCALSLALAQMMLCAAIADSMLVASLGKSCGFGPPFNMYCTSNLSMKPFQPTPDGNASYEEAPVSLLSAGLLISSAITISLAAVDLDSMLTAQYALFGCLLVACGRFCSTLHNMAGLHYSEADGDHSAETEAALWTGPRPFDAVGPVLFNFAFVVTVPPLSCRARSSEEAIRALVMACIVMGLLYTLVGCIGAFAATNTPGGMDDNLLSLVLRGTNADSLEPLDVFAVVLFGLSQLAAIPVYCELARETLITHMQMENKRHAFLVSHVLPWTIVALTYNSALFEAFVEWSSLLLLGFSNFSLPLLLDHSYTVEEANLHRRTPGTGPDSVLWGFALITASISAVIVQRITEGLFFAEGTFMFTTMLLLHYS